MVDIMYEVPSQAQKSDNKQYVITKALAQEKIEQTDSLRLQSAV